MSMIEGIGDEVATFFIVMNIVLIVIIAWITTDTRQQSNIHTVYLMRRTLGRRVRRLRGRTLTNHTESVTISEGTDPVPVEGTSNVEEVQMSANNTPETRIKPPERNEARSRSASRDDSDAEEQSDILHAMDGDLDGLRRRRIGYFTNPTSSIEDLLTENSTYSTSTSTNSCSDLTSEATESTNAQTDTSTKSGAETAEADQSEATTNITIKLKYINDELKIVHGHLEEMLGDFKRRHFESEISSNKLVRLIFNGQVLQRDSDTLQNCGMFDNCVVHCLVHQHRNQPGEGNQNGGNNNNMNNNNNNTNRDWDLGNILIATTSFSLGSAWYFRYQYPQLFTVTATIGLVAVTGIFTVISIGTYFLDVDRSPPPQRAVNFSLR